MGAGMVARNGRMEVGSGDNDVEEEDERPDLVVLER